MNNVKSNEPIYCGVLQGLILGPLRFIVFCNDFADHLEYCNVITYANDSIIFISDKNVSNIETELNMDLEEISANFQHNELTISLKKRKIRGYAFWFESSVVKEWKPIKCHV